ncbi:MAG: PA0069 family radical SAM protein [Halofilum sp. (in: g-proteobacteria)]
MKPTPERTQRKGRGALSNPDVRFEPYAREAVDDGWGSLDEPLAALKTTVGEDHPRRAIAWNDSPDVPFDRSINPYRGCEHGCIYCFARPDHARIGLSPGQDFESRLVRKVGAAARLEDELRKPGYTPAPITLGANTDPYQPIEKRFRVTREILEVLAAFRHPVSIVTKGTLVERDLDLLAGMAEWNGAEVMVSLTSRDARIKRTLEPRAASPMRRLELVERLSAAGVRVGALIAPVIPAITDHELEDLVLSAATAGASSAGYVLLRLPREVESLFREWLELHYPDRAAHVLDLLAQSHHGRHYDSTFGHRQRGSGAYADMIGQRFRAACRKAGIESGSRNALSSEHFRVPPRAGDQLGLF